MAYTDLLFVFGFLPIYTIIIFLCRESWEKNLVSVVASLLFICWTRPLYYLVVAADAALVYIAGRLKGRPRYNVIRYAVSAVVTLSVLPLAVLTVSEGTLPDCICAVGFVLMAARSYIYLKEEQSEKNAADLAVYLISFEFMAISPLYSYSQIRDEIKNRKSAGLSMLSAGISRFAGGLAAVTVLAYPLERIRAAALTGESLPWMNALIGAAAAAVCAYVAVTASLSMSEGLCLISGYRIKLENSAFLPRTLMAEHVEGVYPSAARALKKYLGGKKTSTLIILSAVTCLVTGAFVGFGAGAAALLGIVCLAVLLQTAFETERSVLSGVFSALMLAAGFIIAANGSLNGVMEWFSGLNPSKYEFDMSYALFTELKRSAVWAVLAILYISPLRIYLRAKLREAMSASETAYGGARILDLVLCVLLLALSCVAMVSAV